MDTDNLHKLFSANDVIYIDASSLMNTPQLKVFLEDTGEVLHETGMQIIIPDPVRAEIARHLGSKNPEKARKAMDCISVIQQYPGLVALEGTDLSDTILEEVHADRSLIARLTIEKTIHRQLLITNDKALASDVLKINFLESCPGKRVSACYIDRYGKLRCCHSGENHHASEVVALLNTPTAADETTISSTTRQAAQSPVSVISTEDTEGLNTSVPAPLYAASIAAGEYAGSLLQKHPSRIVDFFVTCGYLFLKGASYGYR